jgi:hypothetical protein
MRNVFHPYPNSVIPTGADHVGTGAFARPGAKLRSDDLRSGEPVLSEVEGDLVFPKSKPRVPHPSPILAWVGILTLLTHPQLGASRSGQKQQIPRAIKLRFAMAKG